MHPEASIAPEIFSKLIVFCVLSLLYLLYSDTALVHGLWHATILKCSPVLCLSWLVRTGAQKNPNEKKIRSSIFYGLIFSCIGDAFLVWDLFIFGMISFAVAHIYYIYAFGFKPLKIEYGLLLYALCGVVTYMLIPGLNGVLLYGVPIYSFILVTMVWRSLAFTNRLKRFSWVNKVVRISAISWMLSDALLGISKFLLPIPFSQFLIMFTYYFGQLGMAISTLPSFKK